MISGASFLMKHCPLAPIGVKILFIFSRRKNKKITTESGKQLQIKISKTAIRRSHRVPKNYILSI